MITEHLIAYLKYFYLPLPLLIGLSIGLSAQLPTLEFLDHSEVETELLSVEIVGEEIVYAARNSRSGQTFVRVVGEDGRVFDLLEEPISFNGEAEMYMDSDGILWVLLYNLVSGTYSDFSTDVFVLSYDGQTASMRWIQGIPAEFSLSLTTTVALDSLNQLYSVADNRLYRVNLDGAEEIAAVSSDGQLLSNALGAVFYLDQSAETLYSVMESSLVEKASLLVNFIGHKLFGVQNVMVFNNLIQVYDIDFNSLVNEYISPVEIYSVDQVLVQEDGILILSSDEGILEIFWMDENLEAEIIFSTSEDLGQSKSLLYFSEDYLITAGEFQLSNISNQLFFRKFPRFGAFLPERANIFLFDFRVSLNKDTLIAGAPPLEIYDAFYTLRSEDETDYELIHLYSSRYLPNVSNSPIIQKEHHSVFEVSNEVDLQSRLLTTIPFHYPMIVGIPGADYRFNAYALATTSIELISNVVDMPTIGKLELFPNPAAESIHLLTETIPNFVEVYDLTGNRVYFESEPTSQSVDISELPSGLYFIRLVEQGKVYSGGFVRR
ncbi:MAG: T9SS C-terminal target domain-containing protein [Saprospirales bacterium]|nr:MAG: T9SS C-terminal target domain-containing protein [Saprospirales bacterium]